MGLENDSISVEVIIGMGFLNFIKIEAVTNFVEVLVGIDMDDDDLVINFCVDVNEPTNVVEG